jgi:hypothetical protein
MHAARHGLSPYTPITLRALRAERPGLFHPNQDWFDGAKLSVSEDSPAYRYALEMIEILSQ